MTRLTDERLRWFLRDDVSPASPEVIPMAREILLLRAEVRAARLVAKCEEESQEGDGCGGDRYYSAYQAYYAAVKQTDSEGFTP